MKEVWSGQDQTSLFVSALPIFPGRRQPSIFGANELNCRVRYGNGWTLTAISTDCVRSPRSPACTRLPLRSSILTDCPLKPFLPP